MAIQSIGSAAHHLAAFQVFPCLPFHAGPAGAKGQPSLSGGSKSRHEALYAQAWKIRSRSSQRAAGRVSMVAEPEAWGQSGGRRWAIQMLLGACISSIAMPMTAIAKGGELGAADEAKSGGLAGFAVHLTKQTILYPLDTIKVRMQAEKVDPTRPFWTRGEIFKGAYKGFLVPLVFNSPASAVFFAVKDSTKSMLKSTIGNAPSTVAAILAAQGPYWLIRQPSEAIKVRAQIASQDGASRFESIRREFSALDPRKPGAMAALFTGFWSNIAYAFPADATKFVCYDVLKQALGGKPKDPLLAATLGALSSTIAQITTTPLDVARNRIMSRAPSEGTPKGTVKGDTVVSMCQTILKEEGVGGLFIGLYPRIGRAVLSGAIQFATYEVVKKK